MGQVHAYPCCPCRLGHGCVHLVETERDGAAQLAFDGTTVFIVPGIECRYDDTAFMLEKHIKLSGRFCVSLVNGVFFSLTYRPCTIRCGTVLLGGGLHAKRSTEEPEGNKLQACIEGEVGWKGVSFQPWAMRRGG